MTIIVYTDPVDGKQRRIRPAPGFTLAQAAAQVPAGTAYEQVPDPPGRNYIWQSAAWQSVAAPPVMSVPKGKLVRALGKLHQNLSGSLAASGDPRAFGTVRDAAWAQPSFGGLTPREQWENDGEITRDPAIYPALRNGVIALKGGAGNEAAADAFLDVAFNLASTL